MTHLMHSVRINKYLSRAGVCSKRQADRLVLSGDVRVNGQLAVVGQLVTEADNVVVKGQAVGKQPESVYLLYHKPVGVVCTNDQTVAGNLVDALNYPLRVFAVGRLDKNSEGLLLLTNDGAVFNRILKAENAHEKAYLVTVDKVITDSFLAELASGVPILNTVTLPCVVNKTSGSLENVFNIVLTQGLNLQIRRMCQALGYRVKRLQRTRIMNLHLMGLDSGEVRELTGEEIRVLKGLTRDSIST